MPLLPAGPITADRDAGGPGSDALLELSGIEKAFGGLIALSDVSITVSPRTIVSVIGPNGSGKTTLLNIINGLIRPTSGKITLDGLSIERLKPYERARLGIARTFQHPRVFGGLTVLDNVMIGAHVFGGAKARSKGASRSFEHARPFHSEADALQILDIVQIPRRIRYARVQSLSLREQRAVELARALMMQPRLLLLDEPATGMDPLERPAWITHMRDVQVSLGLTMVLVEHSMKIVGEISDWVVVLSSGRMLAQGRATDVLANPEVRSVYIGRGVRRA
jgi:branched-chain amino acid transport system ATP-binding protein